METRSRKRTNKDINEGEIPNLDHPKELPGRATWHKPEEQEHWTLTKEKSQISINRKSYLAELPDANQRNKKRKGLQPVEPDEPDDARPRVQQPNPNSAGTPRVQSDQDASLRDLPDLEVYSVDGASPTRRLVAFVQSLWKAAIKQDVLTLPEDVWIGGTKKLQFLRGKLLVRRCYTDLRNALISTSEEQLSRLHCARNFLITGTSGIGKSMFAYYMIRELMMLEKTIVWQPSSGSKKAVCITSTTLSFAQQVDVFADQLQDASTWYVVDGQPPEHCTAITLLVSPPARHIWKQFVKDGAVTRYMPTWSKTEIDMLKTRQMAFDDDELELPQSEIDQRFRKWGGIPYFVFQRAHDDIEQDSLEAAIRSADIEKIGKFVGDTDEWDASHKVMHMKVMVDGPEERWYKRYVMDFASWYVRRKLRKRLVLCNHEKIKELMWAAARHPMAAAFHRMLFETYLHSFLLSRQQFQIAKERVHKLGGRRQRGGRVLQTEEEDIEERRLAALPQ